MDRILWQLDDRLSQSGNELSVRGHIDQAGYTLGEHDFSLPSGIDYELVLTHAGDGILTTGLVRAQVLGLCDRCLEPAEFAIAGEVNEYYLFEPPALTGATASSDGDDETDFRLVSADNQLDLSDPLYEALLIETPFVVLCSEDCQGLCPRCGASLNEAVCTCAQLEEQTPPDGPFSVLSQLMLNPEDETPPESLT